MFTNESPAARTSPNPHDDVVVGSGQHGKAGADLFAKFTESPDKGGQADEEGELDEGVQSAEKAQATKRPFLKRQSQKVPMRKVDWSSVQSKTRSLFSDNNGPDSKKNSADGAKTTNPSSNTPTGAPADDRILLPLR